jgi:hypothetical protein
VSPGFNPVGTVTIVALAGWMANVKASAVTVTAAKMFKDLCIIKNIIYEEQKRDRKKNAMICET